jgi:hypothetical protein
MNNIISFDGLAVTPAECAAICRLFGFIDPDEFRRFASNQQRKHEDRQLNRAAGWQR